MLRPRRASKRLRRRSEVRRSGLSPRRRQAGGGGGGGVRRGGGRASPRWPTARMMGIEKTERPCIASLSERRLCGSSFMPPKSEFQKAGAVPKREEASATPRA